MMKVFGCRELKQRGNFAWWILGTVLCSLCVGRTAEMFFWFAAAAAGAGYLAKRWQSIASDGNRESLLQGNVANVRMVSVKKLSGIRSSDHASGMKGVLSISELQSGFSRNEKLKGQEVGNRFTGNVSDNCGDFSPNPSTEKMDSSNDSMRKRHRTKFSHAHFIKPTSSLESCLMALLCKEHAKMEEYARSSLPSPAKLTMGTLFVTSGNGVVSSTYDDSCSAQTRTKESKQSKEAFLENNENIHGVPPLLKIGNVDPTKKMKAKTRKAQDGNLSKLSKMTNGKDFHFKGLHDGMVLFCFGISIGILCSFIKNKSEVDKLKVLLKRTEDLVQDLQEELEMKNSLTITELVDENYKLQDATNGSISEDSHFQTVEENSESISSIEAELEAELERLEMNMNASTLELEMKNSLTITELVDENYKSQDATNGSISEDSDFQTVEENSESISSIEAELEAELERLEMNMNASTLERRLSDLVELDPDFVADFAQGELRVDKLEGVEVARSQSNSSSTTHHSGNYAVSPRELSLRLHEVIQSRLEERVNELEIALQNSRQRIQIMESGRKYQAEFSNGRLYSSMQEKSSAVSPRELSLRLHEVIQSRLEEHVNEPEIALQNSRQIQIMESGRKYQGEFSNGRLYSSMQDKSRFWRRF